MKKILIQTFQVIMIQSFSQANKLVSRIILARILSVYSFGIFSLIMLWSTLLSPIISLGTEKLITKQISSDSSEKGYREGQGVILWSAAIILSLTFFLMLLIQIFQNPISEILELPNWYLFIILFIAFSIAVLEWQFSILNGLLRPGLGRIPQYVLLPFLILSFLVYCYQASIVRLELIINGYAIIYGFSLVMGFILVYKNWLFNKIRRLNVDFSNKGAWANYSITNFLSVITQTFLAKLDILFISLLLTTETVGFYAIPSNIFFSLTFINFAFSIVLEPKVSYFHKNGEINRLLPFIRSNIYIQLLIALLLYTIIFFFGDLILLLFGEEFMAMHDVLKIISIVLIIQAITGPATVILTMTGRTKERLKSNLISLAVAAAIYPILINQMGVYGAAWAFAISMTTTRIGYVFFLNKALKINMIKLMV